VISDNIRNPLVLTTTIRGGKKLMHHGYYYTVEKISANNKVFWKCERTCTTTKHARCTGRAATYVFVEPVNMLNEHNHLPEPEREDGL